MHSAFNTMQALPAPNPATNGYSNSTLDKQSIVVLYKGSNLALLAVMVANDTD